MNKIKSRDQDTCTLVSDNKEEIYLFTKGTTKKIFNIEKNAHLTIYHYNINSDVEVEINLNGEQASIQYHFSTINYDNHKLTMKINHNYPKTISNVYNHAVNVLDNSLSFIITGDVIKDTKGCICNQENQIINLQNGKSTILPSLLIANYDVSSAHSAYIGKFKEDVLFYLMSRGLPRSKAIELLINGLLINHGSADKEEVIKFKKEIEKI